MIERDVTDMSVGESKVEAVPGMKKVGLGHEVYGYKEALDIYQQVRDLGISEEWVHYDQMIRATASIVANLAEGAGRFRGRPTPDTARFIAIARGSLYELNAWLQIAIIDGQISESQYQSFVPHLDGLSRRLYGLVRLDRGGQNG